jgi:phage baseplate assembly protein V
MSAERKLADFITRVMAPLRTKVNMLIARAVVEAVKDSTGIQGARVSVLKGEVLDGIERLQEWGFTSTPLPDAEGVVIFPFGNRENGFLIAVDDRRVRPKDVPAGAAAIYSADPSTKTLKQVVRVLPDGTIELGKGTLENILNGATFQARFNNHTQIGNLGVPTGKPIVQSPAGDLSSKVKAVT